METKALGGMDSLLSVVQMPRGVPVATVAINGARNAGILAAQIIALHDADVAAKLETMKSALAGATEKKS
jgi:5-(carboxyamino)imidazole ribonucleotide mutase